MELKLLFWQEFIARKSVLPFHFLQSSCILFGLDFKHKITIINIMDTKQRELKEIIRIHTPLADEGNMQAMQLVINAQIELDEILEAEQNQLKLKLTQ
jgi:hypothetical protein